MWPGVTAAAGSCCQVQQWGHGVHLHPLYLEALGRLGGGGWQLVLGGQPGPGRAGPGAGDVARGVAGGGHGQHQQAGN